MSTVPITCPNCGKWVRVAVQPAQIRSTANVHQTHLTQLHVEFHHQTVAHICEIKETQDE